MPNCLPFSRRMATPGWPGRRSCPFIISQKLAGAVVILPRQQPSVSGSQPSAGANRRIDDSAVGHASHRDFWCLAVGYGLAAGQVRGSQILDLSSVGQAMAEEGVVNGTALYRCIS